MQITETFGKITGLALSPISFAGSLLRKKRIVHPTGLTFRCRVSASTKRKKVAPLIKKIQGVAMVRMSNSLWSNGLEWPDALGMAVRFGWQPQTPYSVTDKTQDLILGSFSSVLTLPFSPLLTNSTDFSANTYFSAVPYETEELGKVHFRLVPRSMAPTAEDRSKRLLAWVATGRASFALQYREADAKDQWQEIATLSLVESIHLNQERLSFSTEYSGAGIKPVGFVNAIRQLVYKASTRGRNQGAGTSSSLKEPRLHLIKRSA